MRYRLLRSLSVSAPRMTVQSHVPAWMKICVGVLIFAVAVAVGVVIGRFGSAPARAELDATLGRLMQENRDLRVERDRLAGAGGTLESQRVMENATINELNEQVAKLEAENAHLKEDVAFFEAATAGRTPATAVDAASGIALRRFQVTEDKATHRVRYRLLLTQDAKANRDFVGSLELVASVLRNGRAAKIAFPDPSRPDADDADATRYAVALRSYKRIDGMFDLPADATLTAVEALVLEHGVVKVRRTIDPE
jgi:hypothetical protein